MDDSTLRDQIEQLVAEEQRLMQEAEGHGPDDARHGLLAEFKVELDRCWDLLRQREARPPQYRPSSRRSSLGVGRGCESAGAGNRSRPGSTVRMVRSCARSRFANRTRQARRRANPPLDSPVMRHAWSHDNVKATIKQGDRSVEVYVAYQVVQQDGATRWRGEYKSVPVEDELGEPVQVEDVPEEGDADLRLVNDDKARPIVITQTWPGDGAGSFTGSGEPPR